MRVVAYSIKTYEKELLAIANNKKHDLTLISNRLTLDTCCYAKGKDAVLVFVNDDVSAPVIEQLALNGIKYIATRSAGTDHIDLAYAQEKGIQVASVPNYSPEAIAEFGLCLALALSRKLIPTTTATAHFDFRNETHVGFNFHGKTVGIIGLGNIGLASARAYHGLGCVILGHDEQAMHTPDFILKTTLSDLLQKSDIITLHLPQTAESKHLINKKSIAQMKNGVMLINTSRGGIVNTKDVIDALKDGQIGFFGTDVYEFESGLFFVNHSKDEHKDKLLSELLKLNNVIISPHQAFLTKEAIEQIEEQSIAHIDSWQNDLNKA